MKLRKIIFFMITFIFVISRRMYANFKNYEGSAQDQLTSPPGQLASASPKGIKYNHADWGKPINFYDNINNLNNSKVPDRVPMQVQDQVTSQVSTTYISPQVQNKIHMHSFTSL